MAKKDEASTVTSDRRGNDRRAKSDDRRKQAAPVAVERRKLERREKVSRRRQIDPTTCERDYSIEEVEFMNALNDYKRKSGRMFPTCSEMLEVIRSLGYAKPGQGPAVDLPPGVLPNDIQPNANRTPVSEASNVW